MAESEKITEEQEGAQNDFDLDEPQFADWFLQQIVEFANLGLEIGVTLSVEGSTITGTLIGGRAYFEELSNLLLKASGEKNDVGQTLSELWGEHKNLYHMGGEGSDEQPTEQRAPPAFLHLRGAEIVSPSGARMPSGEGFLWRGRVSAVSGFAIGKLEQS